INIFVDPIYFSSVLTNIFDNSAKYKNLPKGKVSITCYVVEGESICLLFDDNGPGVSNDGLEKLFDVFYRNDPSRNNPQKGSGLGLAIVKKSIAYMGGCIEASNLPYGGLRMKILLPIWKGEQCAEDINYRG
ncbi:MAG: sensor histidine kinase, partial [Lachnospiraceae bacterium]